VQKAPAVTSFTTVTDALGLGEEVSDATGVGDEVTSVVGAVDSAGFATATPLFQINLPFDLMHVNLTPLEIFTEFNGLHAVPDLTAPNALEGESRLNESRTTNEIFFILAFPQ
jgi:hypothetical protein